MNLLEPQLASLIHATVSQRHCEEGKDPLKGIVEFVSDSAGHAGDSPLLGFRYRVKLHKSVRIHVEAYLVAQACPNYGLSAGSSKCHAVQRLLG